ncbi:MAG: hypothetical protein Ct9H300mP1_16110 [Planctomycetaceae bacterium]|nr:MAG: hypothetical protein Ct9H300mP1_16110 [Planctomycetaceae bacterium]
MENSGPAGHQNLVPTRRFVLWKNSQPKAGVSLRTAPIATPDLIPNGSGFATTALGICDFVRNPENLVLRQTGVNSGDPGDPRRLGEYVGDHFAVDIGQPSLDSVVVDAETAVLESGQVQDCGVDS